MEKRALRLLLKIVLPSFGLSRRTSIRHAPGQRQKMHQDTPFSERFEYHWVEIQSRHIKGTCYYNFWKPAMQLQSRPPLVVYIGGMLTDED